MSKHAKKQKLEVQVQGNNIRVRIANSILRFSSLYNTKKIWVQVLWVSFLGSLSAVFGVFFIENTGLYDTGLNAISQGFGRIAYYFVYDNGLNSGMSAAESSNVAFAVFNSLFWGIYLVLNIPLIIFSWYKIGKKFTVMSSIYVVISTVGPLAISFIPGAHDVFLLGDLNLNTNTVFADHNVQLVLWNAENDAQKHFTIFLYGILWGLLQGVILAGLLVVDSSTGDFDFLAIWYSESRYKDIGLALSIVNQSALIVGYIIGTFVPASLALTQVNATPNTIALPNDANLHSEQWSAGVFFSPNLLSSFLMNLLISFFLNILYPKFQMMRAEIYSPKAEAIADWLIADNRPYSLSIQEVKGGYSKKPQQVLITNCMFIEAADLLEVVRKFDASALFVLSTIKKVDGYINLSRKQKTSSSSSSGGGINLNDPPEMPLVIEHTKTTQAYSQETTNGHLVSEKPTNTTIENSQEVVDASK
ncbi:DUF2179 domain-containing protein [[Mycoplasma] testudinis]|uniref:DUF2179 domain-containing protein n=1 Tax=[Mycoplasma] testudinis TaxID=33924 RepID=UPI000486C0D7|nr:YitT family protein [[Mycoplasma] testudinis]